MPTNKAVEKIKAEMEKEKNPYVQVLGQFLLNHIESNPGDAEKIVAEDKTIRKSLNVMKKAAEKKKVGNCAVLTDQEGFQIVLGYYGIKGSVATAPAPTLASAPSAPAKPQSDIEFDVNLDDFLK